MNIHDGNMHHLTMVVRMQAKAITKLFNRIFLTVFILALPVNANALNPDIVKTYHDSNGWKLQVNGNDYYIKGVVWGYSPRGENYTYNLWGETDEHIRNVLDHDFTLMKKANINSIRAFSTIPPKWVTYIYKEYGIMTALNPLMGRYGATIGGTWKPVTDYSDPLTRATLKADVLEIVEEYKNTPGLLMFALGNESNYGLEWSASFEIENLPDGEKHIEKAKYLYSLYNEIIREGKAIDSNHPFTIVNGDIQYIDLIKEYVTDLDLLGSNAYRGINFTELWKDVDEKLDLPVLFFEMGSDAFNAKNFAEDQAAQASFLKAQWQEMYNKSYGNGQEGNSIGGFVFEWRDEWWKYKQTENLNIHDRNASWASGGYTSDHVEGQNNMNEEWWGITALGQMNNDGVYEAIPRMAYDVLSAVWKIDPYKNNNASFNQSISNIDMDYKALVSEVRLLRSQMKEKESISLTGGSLQAEGLISAFDGDINEDGEDGLVFADGQMVFLDFEFQPTKKLSGQFSLNILGNVADKKMEFSYGDRGIPFVVRTPGVISGDFVVDTEIVNPNRVEIYDFNSTYETEDYDLLTFYHVPRYHWMYKGDFYGLLKETTDLTGENGQDIWNSKAPYGAEFIGKQSFAGLTVLLGPEVYWGANPKIMLKYDFDLAGTGFTFMHAQDIARREKSTGATEATSRQSSQTTLYTKRDLGSGTTIELGGIVANSVRIGDSFTLQQGGNIVTDKIRARDTLGVKAKLSFDLTNTSRAYLATNLAGLVADGGAELKEFGTQLPYSEYGNKKEVEGGILFNFNTFTIYPRFLLRDNIVDANPTIPSSTTGTLLNPGLNPRDRDSDPFAVLDNREARSAELIFTYDPTPATSFYEWDNDVREDAGFAFNVGGIYTRYPTATDAHLFFLEEINSNASFGKGLAAAEVWKTTSKIVTNPSNSLKIITNIEIARQQTTGEVDVKANNYYELDMKFVINKSHILSGYVKKDAWGPYDFQRQFNLIYPYQYKIDYAYLMDPLKNELRSSKIGIRTLYRRLGENSEDEEYLDGKNSYMFEIIAYMKFNF